MNKLEKFFLAIPGTGILTFLMVVFFHIEGLSLILLPVFIYCVSVFAMYIEECGIIKKSEQEEQERLQKEALERQRITQEKYNREQEQLRQQQERQRIQFEEQARLKQAQDQKDRENQAEAARLLALKRDREVWEEKIYREEMELRIRNNAMFDFYKKQLGLIAEHKRQGMDIDKEIMDTYNSMKKDSEKEENKDMFEGLFDLLKGMQ